MLLAFTLGPAEIVGLLVVLIFLFGPSRIPEIGKSVGEALTSFKKATRDTDRELETSEQKKLEEPNTKA